MNTLCYDTVTAGYVQLILFESISEVFALKQEEFSFLYRNLIHKVVYQLTT